MSNSTEPKEPKQKPSAEDILDSVEDALEERKTKSDRRQTDDPNNPYSQPEKDRRSGIDRRDEQS